MQQNMGARRSSPAHRFGYRLNCIWKERDLPFSSGKLLLTKHNLADGECNVRVQGVDLENPRFSRLMSRED